MRSWLIKEETRKNIIGHGKKQRRWLMVFQSAAKCFILDFRLSNRKNGEFCFTFEKVRRRSAHFNLSENDNAGRRFCIISPDMTCAYAKQKKCAKVSQNLSLDIFSTDACNVHIKSAFFQ